MTLTQTKMHQILSISSFFVVLTLTMTSLDFDTQMNFIQTTGHCILLFIFLTQIIWTWTFIPKPSNDLDIDNRASVYPIYLLDFDLDL